MILLIAPLHSAAVGLQSEAEEGLQKVHRQLHRQGLFLVNFFFFLMVLQGRSPITPTQA